MAHVAVDGTRSGLLLDKDYEIDGYGPDATGTITASADYPDGENSCCDAARRS